MAKIEFSIGDYRYEVIRDGEVSVKVIDKSKDRYDPIPCTVEHEGIIYTVTKMGGIPLLSGAGGCFDGCSSLVEAPVIPDSVTDMSYCFRNCRSLAKAPTIPDGVTDMTGCFQDCSSLVKAPVIPDGVKYIDNYFDFHKGDYKYSVVGDGEVSVEVIDKNKERYEPIPSAVFHERVAYVVVCMDFCFKSCRSLVEAPAIPNDVREMVCCFESCTSLVEAPVIPDGVKVMDS